MTEEDIAQVRKGFVESTKRALRIGFDAIELHMAHGYLIHAFTSPISNKRNDEYGGDLKGRMRFGLEVLREVRKVVPKGVPLGTRISAIDWLDGGLTIEDSIAWVKAMKEEGLEFVCVSSGGVNAEARLPLDAGFNVPLAEKIKRETGVTTRAVGLITDPHHAEVDHRGRQGRSGRARARHPRRSALGLARRERARRRGEASTAIRAHGAEALARRHAKPPRAA